MTDAAGARTAIAIAKDDGSDPFTIILDNIRALYGVLETKGVLYSEGVDASRPAAGTAGRFYKPTDMGYEGILYYDDGTAWRTFGASAAVDAAAGVGSLRTLGAGALQAAAGNHTHARDLFDYAAPGVEATGLLSVGASVTGAAATIVAGPGSGRRLVKALLIASPTAGSVVTLTLAGVTLARLAFSSAGGGIDLSLTLPVANGENLQAAVSGGTATFLASYVDITGATVDRFGMVTSSGSGTLVASTGAARVVNQILVSNPSSTTPATASVTFAGTPILSSIPLPAGGLQTLDLPRPLPAGQAITYAGDGVTACTFLAVGH